MRLRTPEEKEARFRAMRERKPIDGSERLHAAGVLCRAQTARWATWAREARKAFHLELFDRMKYVRG